METVPFSPPAQVDWDAITEVFWASLREGVLSMQRCAHGHNFRMPPTLYCPECHSTESEWVKLSGKATLYTYTVGALQPREADSPKYVAALVCPVEAPDTKIFANVVQCPVEQLAIGMELELVRADEGIEAAWFKPATVATQGDR